MSFTPVLVGAGDLGRTVLAKALLDQELCRFLPGSADQVLIRTAGVDALDGMPPSPHQVAVAAGRGLAVEGHAATAMTREIAESADVLLTTARRQRAQLVLPHPALRNRTFALLELAEVLHRVPALAHGLRPCNGLPLAATLRGLVPVVAERVSGAPAPPEEGRWDLTDPYAQGLDVHERVADEVGAVVRSIVAEVGRLVPGPASTSVRSASTSVRSA